MSSSFVVARTRVTPPPLAPDLLDRPALRARLDALSSGGLGAVVGGAGYGKSCLLTSWAARRTQPTAWVSAAEGDDAPEVLAAHVVAAVEAALGRSVSPALDLERWRTALDVVINVMCENPGLALVIDDAHHLDGDGATRCEALTYLLRYVPPASAVVMGARRMPAMREWNGWVARGRVRVCLAPADLALSRDEVAALVALRDGEGSAPRAVDDRLARVGGWPLGVDLLARAPSLTVSLPEGATPLLDGASAVLDEVIGHDLFEDLRSEEQAFLEDCAVLETWTADVCAAVSARDDAANLLTRLAGLGWVTPAAGGWRMHPVFHDFLSRRRPTDPHEAQARHRRAADALQARGLPHEALPHRLAAGQIEAAADLLDGLALPRTRLLALTERLGDAMLDARPGLRVARGRAMRKGGAYEQALCELDRAAQRASSLGLADVQAEALAEAASVYVDTVQPARAHARLRQAFRLVSPTRVEQRARILDLIAENCVNQGRAAAAVRYRRWSRATLSRSRDGALDARMLLRTGQLAAARATVEGRLASQPATAPAPSLSPDPIPAEAHREEVLVLSYVAALEGDAASAEAAARRGLALGVATASAFTEALGWMRLGHALQLRSDAAFDEVVACYARAQALAERTGVARVRAEALMGLALAYAARGDVPRSYANATEGLAITVQAGDRWLSAWMRLATGISGQAGGHPDAAAVIRAAREEVAACRDGFGVAVADLWLALATGKGLEIVAEALHTRGYAFLLERPTLFGPRVPIDVKTAQETFRMRLQCLGPFRAWRGGEEIGARAWKREKARELFLVLLTRRGQLQQKEALMDLLWPDATPQAANRDFRVALHALSDALDPERPRNALARCLERHGTAYMFRRDADIEIDVDEMERLITLANQQGRPDLWQRALDLYRADFLEDLPYAEWATAERDRLRALYVETAERLARHALAEGDDELALHLAHAILSRDRCWEEAWRIVMRVHQRQGRAFLAARAYEECVAALDDELGVEPSDETRALLETT